MERVGPRSGTRLDPDLQGRVDQLPTAPGCRTPHRQVRHQHHQGLRTRNRHRCRSRQLFVARTRPAAVALLGSGACRRLHQHVADGLHNPTRVLLRVGRGRPSRVHALRGFVPPQKLPDYDPADLRGAPEEDGGPHRLRTSHPERGRGRGIVAGEFESTGSEGDGKHSARHARRGHGVSDERVEAGVPDQRRLNPRGELGSRNGAASGSRSRPDLLHHASHVAARHSRGRKRRGGGRT
mmetsp:Transcript_11339/g.20525  ORF Transcript_11339/g.20525 Transcript_11339/m.20525 type:complete len:238 (+) Transcript_11339:141-854(+)